MKKLVLEKSLHLVRCTVACRGISLHFDCSEHLRSDIRLESNSLKQTRLARPFNFTILNQRRQNLSSISHPKTEASDRREDHGPLPKYLSLTEEENEIKLDPRQKIVAEKLQNLFEKLKEEQQEISTAVIVDPIEQESLYTQVSHCSIKAKFIMFQEAQFIVFSSML